MYLNVAFGRKGLRIIVRFWKLPRDFFGYINRLREIKLKYILLFRNL